MYEIKNHLLNLNYNFKEITNEILLIENFLQEDETGPLWKIINNATQHDWEVDYINSQKELALRRYNSSDIDFLISEGIMEYTYDWADKAIAIPEKHTQKLNKRIAELFEFDENLWYGHIDTIQRQYSGSKLTEHIDSDGDPDILYAVIAYLNDDYIDGELFFPNINISVKPPKNSIIIFPDGKDYKHGVKAPGDGPTRYVLPTFVRHVTKSHQPLHQG